MSLKPIPSAAELRSMTPPQVDEHFANVYDEEYRLGEKRYRAVQGVFPEAGAKKLYERRMWSMTFAEALLKVQEFARNKPQGSAAQVLREIAEVDRELADLAEGPQRELDREFTRRGGWTRAYLVTDGHVHRSRQCSTCNNGEFATKFSWMIDYSGKSEEEIVAAAGDRACTVCYPSAPVARGEKVGPSLMFTPEEIERDQARQKAAEVKADRAAKKAAKAITDVDGSPLTAYRWTQKAHQKRMRDGRLVDVPEREFSDTLETLHAARGWLTDQFEANRSDGGHRDVGKVVAAVAAKEGKTSETVVAEARERARKRRR